MRRYGLGLLMGKFHEFFTELSAHDTMMVGYYCFRFLLADKIILSGAMYFRSYASLLLFLTLHQSSAVLLHLYHLQWTTFENIYQRE